MLAIEQRPRFAPLSVLQRYGVEIGWAAFAAVNYVAMVAWSGWETIPFHFIWISLTLVYGFRVWPVHGTLVVLGVVMGVTAVSISLDAFEGTQLWGELFEVPLMAAMFLAMVWHARRRVDAQRIAEQRADEGRSLLERQERFIHDVSHELRTPMTIARGHLELLRSQDPGSPELWVALDELGRMDGIVERLLMLARAGQPDFVTTSQIDLESFLEDVFMRWSELAPRAWRLGPIVSGWLPADADRLRTALDALIENAVKYTQPHDAIEIRARLVGDHASIEVQDEGRGVSKEALTRIFDRFARADSARTRAAGGVGLGLAIADAIAKAHGGGCHVTSTGAGSIFSLRLPGFIPTRRAPVPGDSAPAPAPPAGLIG
jgi:signal transduction histidine kinase